MKREPTERMVKYKHTRNIKGLWELATAHSQYTGTPCPAWAQVALSARVSRYGHNKTRSLSRVGDSREVTTDQNPRASGTTLAARPHEGPATVFRRDGVATPTRTGTLAKVPPLE